MDQLGLQGRAVAQRMMAQRLGTPGQNVPIVPDSQQTHQLQILLQELLQPSKQTEVHRLLQTAAYELSIIKNKYNVSLLIHALSQSPLLLYESFLDISVAMTLVESLRSAVTRKHQISQPSLSCDDFYDSLISGVQAIQPAWKRVPIISGILMANVVNETTKIRSMVGKLQELLVEAVNITFLEYHVDDVRAISLVSFSGTYSRIPQSVKAKLPFEHLFTFGVYLIFSSRHGLNRGDLIHDGDNLRTIEDPRARLDKLFKSPVLGYLSPLSLLVKDCVVMKGAYFDGLERSLGEIVLFSDTLAQWWASVHRTNREFSNDEKVWNTMKMAVFSTIVVLEAYVSLSYHLRKKLLVNVYLRIFCRILECLFNLNFVVYKIGTNGFSVYNFVYLSCLDGLLESSPKEAQILGLGLSNSCHMLAAKNDPVEFGKSLFLLNYFEHLVQVCDTRFSDDVILPIARLMLTPQSSFHSSNMIQFEHIRPLFESAHSVVLASLSVPDNAQMNLGIVPDYLKAVLVLFPSVLSAHQFLFAIESIAKAIFPPGAIYTVDRESTLGRLLMDTLLDQAYAVKPGVPLPTTNGDVKIPADTQQEGEPPTIRAVIIASLMNVLAYSEIQILELWLSKVWFLIQTTPTLSPLDVEERAFLKKQLWGLITDKLDLHKANIGIKWWYANVVEGAQSLSESHL